MEPGKEGNLVTGGAIHKDGSAMKIGDEKKGLVNQGDKTLNYTPKTKENPTPSSWETDATWPKSKTEEFIAKTKGMTLPEFAKHMITNIKPDDETPTIFATQEGHIRPSPYETIRYVTHLALANESVMESLVMEIIRNDGLPALMNELFKHRKCYEEAAATMNADRFIMTVKEMVSPSVAEVEPGKTDQEKASHFGKKKHEDKGRARNARSIDGGQLDGAESDGIKATRGGRAPSGTPDLPV
jgi:hypothetical protein